MTHLVFSSVLLLFDFSPSEEEPGSAPQRRRDPLLASFFHLCVSTCAVICDGAPAFDDAANSASLKPTTKALSSEVTQQSSSSFSTVVKVLQQGDNQRFLRQTFLCFLAIHLSQLFSISSHLASRCLSTSIGTSSVLSTPRMSTVR